MRNDVSQCKSCRSDKQREFTAEVALHVPGLKSLEKPIVWAFPKILVCLGCGKAEFAVPDAQLLWLGYVAGQAGPKHGGEQFTQPD